MHSKVIIASLVCMLAANFGSFKVADVFKNNQPKAEEAGYNAPNDKHAKVTLREDRGEINAGGWFEVYIDVPIASPVWDTVTRNDPYDLIEGYFSNNGKLGATINIPYGNGDYYIGFNKDGKEVAMVYIFVKDGNATISFGSKYTARAVHFVDYIASDNEKMMLLEISDLIDVPDFPLDPHFPLVQANRNRVAFENGGKGNASSKLDDTLFDFGGSSNLGEHIGDHIGGGIVIEHPEIARRMCKADIEKKYNAFVYGDLDDVTTTMTKHTSPYYNGGTQVKVNAYWVDANGNSHVIKDYGFNVYLFGEKIVQQTVSQIVPGTYAEGTKSIYLPYSKTKNRRLKDLAIEVKAMNPATAVLDGNGLAYTHVYMSEATNYVKAYDEINFEVYFNVGESDRANAFSIAEAQLVPYTYAKDFGNNLPRVAINYPADVTRYNPGSRIDVRQEHGTNWDVLNHEYGHYLTDKLNLSRYYDWCGTNYRYHGMKENLISTYGAWTGKKLAYYEGLATYFAIASQLYAGIEDIEGVGDYYYEDQANNVFVNYNASSADQHNGDLAHAGYEDTVTSILLKIMDNKSRGYDIISLGHEEMWNHFHFYDDLDDFIFGLKHDNNLPDYVRNYQLDSLLKEELYDITFTGPARVSTNAAVDSSWTFTLNPDSALMFCGAYRYDLVFQSERTEETYVIQNIPITTTSYTLTREQIINVLALEGCKTNVYARAYSGDNVIFGNSSKIEVTKGGAYDLLCHWAANIDMTSRRYRWVSIYITTTGTYRVQIDGRWTSGQAVKLYNRIILDDETVTPLQTVNGTSNGISFTRSMTRGEYMFIRIDNNCYQNSYNYRVSCAPVNN